MTENTINETGILRSVNSLLKEQFIVPKYQRGYRWRSMQVEDLLNDIDKFIPSNDEGKNSWYCLQPLVIEKATEKADEGKYCLIDGQQRLTTIKLILHYINNRFVEEERKPIFSLDYKTRGKDSDWLKILDNQEAAKQNIDFSHIYNSYQIIKEWFGEKRKQPDFDIFKFQSKLLSDCKFIWYDIAQNGQNKDTGETVFIRLNDGKIPLTNSELIKALFLNSANFAKDKNEEEIRLRQQEISTQWDIIEQELSDEEFWCFINGKENQVNPRIEYIFDISSNNSQEKKNDDPYFTFRYFQTEFEKNEQKQGNKLEFVNNEWEEKILNPFLILKEWYKDRERCYYHRIGYLLCMKIYSVGDLLKDYRRLNKDAFKQCLLQKIKDDLKWNGGEIGLEKDKQQVRKILLLHNLITMQKQENDMSRFSFFHYVETKNRKGWDIEHIHAIAEELPQNPEHRKDWLNEIKDVMEDNELKKEINEFTQWKKDDTFNELVEKINHYYEKNSDIEDSINNLSNLALLDAGTNRSYRNAFYPVKRKKILEKDKEGTFIPVCTRKVFLKYYTSESPNMTFWGKEDRNAYLKDIRNTLSNYLTK